MRTLCETRGPETTFILADVDPVYQDAVRSLTYVPVEGGFGKAFPTSTPGLDGIYHNFQRHAEEMVLQMAGAHPVPWEKCLLSFLEVVQPEDIDWWLCGSAALAVRGMDIEPHDLDLVTGERDAEKLGELLMGVLIEPVVQVEDWFCSRFGRAFMHARLEWVGGVDDRADQPEVTDFGPTAANRLDAVVWRGSEILVPPLDLQLRVNVRRGLSKRVAMIEQVLRRGT
jgi:hypothetical protein